MAKIKHTKNELKAQQDALSRYRRFLPMLLLKKQQLQAEIQSIDAQIDAKQTEYNQLMKDLKSWVALFATGEADPASVVLKAIETEEGNIAGVNIPILLSVELEKASLDLFSTPAWVDDAQLRMADLIKIRAAVRIFQEQRRMINEELRTTSQRVNLFEKIKIPECREHIRIIKIFLGDEQTAAVARGKLAKKRSEKPDENTADNEEGDQ